MPEKKLGSKAKNARKRLYETDTIALQTLNLIATLDPKDKIPEEELAAYFKKHKFSVEMIKKIVETVKAL